MKIIIDCAAIFVDGECYFCGKTKPVANVWINAGALYERNACKSCVHSHSHPLDASLFRKLWYIQEQVKGRVVALKELDDLIEKYPNRKLFVTLRELLHVKYSSVKVTDAIHEFWLGSLPNRSGQHAIATFIRGYRHVRNIFRKQQSSNDTRATSKMYAIYRGTGSCGFL